MDTGSNMPLTGGDLGGTFVTWVPTGVLSSGREYMDIDGLRYASEGTIAVFFGPVPT